MRKLEARYNAKSNNKNRGKSIIDRALKSYQASSADNETNLMDASFAMTARAQIKLFLFAGHDKPSGTICYTYHLLSSIPIHLPSYAPSTLVSCSQSPRHLSASPAPLTF